MKIRDPDAIFATAALLDDGWLVEIEAIAAA